jgi:hypothetical protein
MGLGGAVLEWECDEGPETRVEGPKCQTVGCVWVAVHRGAPAVGVVNCCRGIFKTERKSSRGDAEIAEYENEQNEGKIMKTTFKVLAGFGLLGLVMASTGCAGMKGMVMKQTPVVVRPASTNLVTQVVTNVVEQVVTATNWVVVTNAQGAAVAVPNVTYGTNVTYAIGTNVISVVMPEISYMSNSVAQPVQTAGNVVGFATNAAGVPFVDAGIKVLLAGFGVWLAFLNKKNRRKAEAEAEGHALTMTKLEQAQMVGQTLVENIETIRKAALEIPQYQAIDGKVMQVVQQVQQAAGVKGEVNALVDEHTGYTTSKG